MSLYFDKNGQPLDLDTWCQLLHDMAYKRIAETTLPNGRWVSTVWLGLDHQWGNGSRLIFESMVFPSEDNMSELDMVRYSTLGEAQTGHEAMVQKWSNEP